MQTEESKPKRRRKASLTLRQQVALPIAAAIHSALSREIFNVTDGQLSRTITKRSLEFADVFLAEDVGVAQ